MSSQRSASRVVFWAIWFALLSGVLVMNFAIAPPEWSQISRSLASPLWWVAVLPLALSAVVRWLVLPRFTTTQAALPVFIIGLALAESAAIAGMFVFDHHRAELVVLGLLGIGQFLPIFTNRFAESGNG